MTTYKRKRYVIKDGARRDVAAKYWMVTERNSKIEFQAPCGTKVSIEPETLRELITAANKVLKEYDV